MSFVTELNGLDDRRVVRAGTEKNAANNETKCAHRYSEENPSMRDNPLIEMSRIGVTSGRSTLQARCHCRAWRDQTVSERQQ